jgi:hypothetical protein
MPSRKQRRRREKARRHEYEYVYVDAEGREVSVDAEGVETLKPVAKSEAKRSNGKPAPARTGSTRRKVEPPSWRRALKRSLIFAPFMFITLYLLDRNASNAVRLLVTLQMLVFFIPFTYLIDRTMYRRLGGGAEAPSPAPRRRTATKG